MFICFEKFFSCRSTSLQYLLISRRPATIKARAAERAAEKRAIEAYKTAQTAQGKQRAQAEIQRSIQKGRQIEAAREQ